MAAIYGVLSIVALILIGVCFAVDRKRDFLLLCLVISVFLCILGFFLISISPTLEFALNANRLAYLGQVFLPLLLLLMLLQFCGITCPRWLSVLLGSISVVTFLIAATPGIFPWYYASVDIEKVNGTTHIIREYGPLHRLYYVYLASYFVGMFFVIGYAILKKRVVSPLHVFFLLSAVLCNLVTWLIGQLLPRGFEFLSVCYMSSEIFILLLYGILQEYQLIGHNEQGLTTHAQVYLEQATAEAQVSEAPESNAFFSASDIEHILAGCAQLSILTEREMEVLRHILANEHRKQIAEMLFVTENTIKKHTSSIFKKLDVKNRMELFAKLKRYASL